MAKGRERSRWRVHLSASDEKVRFSIQGDLGRRALVVFAAVIALIPCALIAPEIVAEIARLLKSFNP
ncbi:MAG TPA: hypothetical protein VIK33_09590 [Anaerolineae bacterium]